MLFTDQIFPVTLTNGLNFDQKLILVLNFQIWVLLGEIIVQFHISSIDVGDEIFQSFAFNELGDSKVTIPTWVIELDPLPDQYLSNMLLSGTLLYHLHHDIVQTLAWAEQNGVSDTYPVIVEHGF